MSRTLTNGRWFDLQTLADHDKLGRTGDIADDRYARNARVRYGDWVGPGRYLFLSYYQRCPRNCCDDLVFELLSAAEVAEEARDAIRAHAELLRAAKSPAPATDGPNP